MSDVRFQPPVENLRNSLEALREEIPPPQRQTYLKEITIAVIATVALSIKWWLHSDPCTHSLQEKTIQDLNNIQRQLLDLCGQDIHNSTHPSYDLRATQERISSYSQNIFNQGIQTTDKSAKYMDCLDGFLANPTGLDIVFDLKNWASNNQCVDYSNTKKQLNAKEVALLLFADMLKDLCSPSHLREICGNKPLL